MKLKPSSIGLRPALLAAATLAATPSYAQIETIAATIGAVNGIVSAFRKSDSGGLINILIAISSNLAQINQGMQTALVELAAIRQNQKQIPSAVYEYAVLRNISGRFESLQRLVASAQANDPAFSEYAYFRDLFDLYRQVRQAREELLNNDYEISENIVLHLPMLYILELNSYSLLTYANTGDTSDVTLQPFIVNKTDWLFALNRYFAFYNVAIDPDFTGSFANELRTHRTSLEGMMKQFNGPLVDEILAGSVTSYVAHICYYVLDDLEEHWTVEMDDTGKSETLDEVIETYSLYYREYNFEWIEDDLSSVYTDDTYYMTLPALPDHLARESITTEFYYAGQQGIDCSMIVAASALESEDILKSINIDELRSLMIKIQFLKHINALNLETSLAILESSAPYIATGEITLSDYPFLSSASPNPLPPSSP